jgi:membrane-associated protease RseP (regulator of RpoE activity)
MDELVMRKDAPVLTEIPRYTFSEETAPAPLARQQIPPVNLILFLVTMFTTTMIGALTAGADFSIWHPIHDLYALTAGLSFSLPLMAILLAHEMGHYVTARANGVDTSLPYFIPAPPMFPFLSGTFGAFIRIRQMPRTRRVMFDIGAAGPWAGVIVAIPMLIIGLKLSSVAPLDKSAGGFELGNSILFWGMTRVVLGVDPNTVNINLHATAFAAWIGILVTAINLLPMGQLDGGHVVYALFPRQHRRISILFVITCVFMVVVPFMFGYQFWGGWLLWAVLALMLGVGHPATVDRDTPLDPFRRRAAWLTVVLFAITFSPVPISFIPPQGPQQNPPEHTQEVSYHAHYLEALRRNLPNVRI